MAQLAQRLRLDLADPLARYAELLADLFERPLPTVLQAEPQLKHASFATRQRVEHVVHLLLEHLPRRDVGGAQRSLIGYEVAQVTIFFRSNRDLERNRLLSRLLDLAHAVSAEVEFCRDLFVGGLATDVLLESSRD